MNACCPGDEASDVSVYVPIWIDTKLTRSQSALTASQLANKAHASASLRRSANAVLVTTVSPHAAPDISEGATDLSPSRWACALTAGMVGIAPYRNDSCVLSAALRHEIEVMHCA